MPRKPTLRQVYDEVVTTQAALRAEGERLARKPAIDPTRSLTELDIARAMVLHLEGMVAHLITAIDAMAEEVRVLNHQIARLQIRTPGTDPQGKLQNKARQRRKEW
jgi:hypothetical protein